MLRICLHIEKGFLTDSCSKQLLFLSRKANVAVWRFLMNSLAKNIRRGLNMFEGGIFLKYINPAQIQMLTVTVLHGSPT